MGVLRWILQIFRLHCTGHKMTQNEVYCSLVQKLITAAVLGLYNFSMFYFKVRYIFSEINISIKLTDSIQMFFDYFQYIVDLYFVHKYGREVSLEYYKQYANIDNILVVDRKAVTRSSLDKLTGMFGLLWLTSSLCDFASWYASFGWFNPLVYSVAYVFLLIKIITTLDLTTQVIQIECRLRVMSNLVLDYYDSAEHLPTSNSSDCLIGDSVCNKNWFYSDKPACSIKNKNHCHPLKTICKPNYHGMKWLSRCYLLLTEQCTFINKMFGIRILLNSLSLLIDMIRYTNIAVRIVMGSQHTDYDSGYFPAVASMFRLVTCAAVLTNLVDRCERAYCQRSRMVSIIDHLLINKHPSTEARSAATELRNLAESRPISFNMANFFVLNYSFLVSMASVVVTYTIILLQSMN